MIRFAQSPTDLSFVQDPYPFYDHLRQAGDLAWWEDYNMPVSARHAVVSGILRDRRFGREEPAALRQPVPEHLAPFYAVEAHSMLELEPPRHTRLRGLVLRAFTSRKIATLEPEIAQLCHQLIDTFPTGPFDLIPHFAQKLPVIIIARLLGVPETMADQLLAWSNAMVTMYQSRRMHEDELNAVAATQEFTQFLSDYIERRRASPTDDLISSLIAAETEGEKLSHDEMISSCILLLNAGHEATVHTLGNGIRTLLNQSLLDFGSPQVLAEEVLRHDPPLHMFTRYALEDIELFDHQFKCGDQIGLLLAAANRDPDVFDEPARFDPARFAAGKSAPVHMSLGAGLHFCVGAPLARLEIATALPILLERCPNLSLVDTPTYANLYHFHGLERLMVSR